MARRRTSRTRSVRHRFGWLAVLVMGIWAVEVINFLSGYLLNLWLGLIPRVVAGLDGVLAMPLLHASPAHAAANTVPLLVFGVLLSLTARDHVGRLTLTVVLLGGGAVWCLGSAGIHVGASGLVFGYFGFLVARGVRTRRVRDVLVTLGVTVGYGTMILGVLPLQSGVSWESHLFGALAGAGYALRLRPTRRRS